MGDKETNIANVPFFSIVIPMFNREREIVRAMQSCLRQSFRSFEIVVVDDASTDQSCITVERETDQRIKLYRHEVNKGLYPTRATGVQAARGTWVVFLDSDDELLPEALDTISRTIDADSASSQCYGFAYRIDTGEWSPDPMPAEGQPFEYRQYVEWLDYAKKTDYMRCMLRTTFDRVPLTQGKSLYELLYHLRFTKHYRTRMSEAAVAMIHTDSANRSSNLSLRNRIRKQRQEAKDGYASVEQIWQEHGEALREWAPNTYLRLFKLRGMFQLLNGNRAAGTRILARYLLKAPWSIEGWIILIAGLLGAAPLRMVRALKP